MADQLEEIRRQHQQRWERQRSEEVSSPTGVSATTAPPAAAPVVVAPPAAPAAPPAAPPAAAPQLASSENSSQHDVRLCDSDEYQALLRERAAEKERELQQEHAPVRPPDEYYTDTLAGPPAEVPHGNDLSSMLAEITQQMAAFTTEHGIAPPQQLNFHDADIEAEIDASLAASGHNVQGGTNFLQFFDGHGQPIQIAGGYVGDQVLDPTDGFTGTPAAAPTPVELFDCFSVVSHMHTADNLPQDSRHCPICHEPFHNGEEVRRLNCCHVFHRHCIDQWLVRRTSCPVCKFLFHPHTDQLQEPLLYGKEAELVAAH